MRHLQSGIAVEAGIGLFSDAGNPLMRNFFTRRVVFTLTMRVLVVTALLLPSMAGALPRASPVPGGIALIDLGVVANGANRPRAWFGEQPVLVSADKGHWIAVLGLALDLPERRHELRVSAQGEQMFLSFDVRAKHYPEQRITLKDSSKVNLSAVDEARAIGEIATIQGLKRHWREADDTDSDFVLPADGRLASRFGLRRFFNGEPRAPHSGLDLAVPRGTPIRASAPGRVLAVDDYFFNGKTVFVDHGNGLISMYCHLDRIDVQAGDPVGQGQRLGLSGMSGRVSGPHLHWSVILNGAMVDPELFLPPKALRTSAGIKR
ncbi:peptidoglycan DD-metalloendopeptidase family protein [Propionivibrio sp.]|uniref:peptidoglycan DD-metalloendopeptidase family protein n=1 Tax=Propionivibrio sp. TaxID=2212460 RepID=UPI0025D644FD|nr:peptidoglycan DD-metalloendopeptidase family protein [Propionivibrio sp.]